MERISVEQLSHIGLIALLSSICSQPKKGKTTLLSALPAVQQNESLEILSVKLPTTVEQALLIRSKSLKYYFCIRRLPLNVTRICLPDCRYQRDKGRYDHLACRNNCEGFAQIDQSQLQSIVFFCNVFGILFFHPISAHPIQKLPDFFILNKSVAIQIIQTILASYRNRYHSLQNDAVCIAFDIEDAYAFNGLHAHRSRHYQYRAQKDWICH